MEQDFSNEGHYNEYKKEKIKKKKAGKKEEEEKEDEDMEQDSSDERDYYEYKKEKIKEKKEEKKEEVEDEEYNRRIIEKEKKEKIKIINKIFKEVNEEELNIILELNKYFENFNQYKEFFSENLNKSEFTTQIIEKILNKSEIIIINNENDNYNFWGNYIDIQNKNNNEIKKELKEFGYEYMIYLRDRGLKRQKITKKLITIIQEVIHAMELLRIQIYKLYFFFIIITLFKFFW